MVVRPVSVVVIYRPGQPGPMGPDRTRIPAIVIIDVYVGTALKNYISASFARNIVQKTPSIFAVAARHTAMVGLRFAEQHHYGKCRLHSD